MMDFYPGGVIPAKEAVQRTPLRGEGPLTRPMGDLSHKGRGIHTGAATYAYDERKWLIVGKDTSPLVGEVGLLLCGAKAKGRVRGIKFLCNQWTLT
jgi:hypothetical protein